MANHSGPESCGMHREVQVEALTGETDRPAIAPRNHNFGMPTLLDEAEGNMVHDDNRKSCVDPTRSETLRMSGSLLHGSSEISSVSDAGMRATLAAVRKTLMRRRHEPIPVIGRWLGSVVRGYFNYYAVPGNMCRLNSFRSEVSRAWRHALKRRSQRHRLSWSRFRPLIKKYLPPCRVVHPLPSERFHVKTFGRSRMQ